MTAVVQRQPSRVPRYPTVLEFVAITNAVTNLRDDLEYMVAEGMLEASRDENNVLRFRPVGEVSR